MTDKTCHPLSQHLIFRSKLRELFALNSSIVESLLRLLTKRLKFAFLSGQFNSRLLQLSLSLGELLFYAIKLTANGCKRFTCVGRFLFLDKRTAAFTVKCLREVENFGHFSREQILANAPETRSGCFMVPKTVDVE